MAEAGGGEGLNFAPLSPVKRTLTRGVWLPDLGESEEDGIQFPSADFLIFSQGSSLLKGQAGCLAGADLFFFGGNPGFSWSDISEAAPAAPPDPWNSSS